MLKMATGKAPEALLSPADVDLRNTAAVITWGDDQPLGIGASMSSTPVSLDIDLNHATRTASFRLRIALYQRGSDKAVPVYLVIDSHRIVSIGNSRPGPTQTQEGQEGSCGGDAICLLFQFNGPCTLVMPPESLHPKDKVQAATLKSVRIAAQQRALTIHLPGGALSPPHLTALSETIYKDFASSRRHTEIGRLYGGRGGKVVEFAAVQGDGPAEPSPPSYQSLEAPPPLPPIADGKASFPPSANTSHSRDRCG